jgi:hypothetical protein
MSQILDFYNDDGKDNLGRTLEDILNCEGHTFPHNFAWLEAAHDWIQWLFPSRKESNFNPDAPLLTDEDVTIFRSAIQSRGELYYRVMDTTEMFLAFLGIGVNWFVNAEDTVTHQLFTTENFEAQKYTWIGPLNHNHLRITRFLAFLCIVGLNDFAKSVVEFMKKTASEKGGWINPRSLGYWEGEGLQAT